MQHLKVNTIPWIRCKLFIAGIVFLSLVSLVLVNAAPTHAASIPSGKKTPLSIPPVACVQGVLDLGSVVRDDVRKVINGNLSFGAINNCGNSTNATSGGNNGWDLNVEITCNGQTNTAASFTGQVPVIQPGGFIATLISPRNETWTCLNTSPMFTFLPDHITFVWGMSGALSDGVRYFDSFAFTWSFPYNDDQVQA